MRGFGASRHFLDDSECEVMEVFSSLWIGFKLEMTGSNWELASITDRTHHILVLAAGGDGAEADWGTTRAGQLDS